MMAKENNDIPNWADYWNYVDKAPFTNFTHIANKSNFIERLIIAVAIT